MHFIDFKLLKRSSGQSTEGLNKVTDNILNVEKFKAKVKKQCLHFTK